MISLTAPQALLTGIELLALGDIGPCELIDGKIVRTRFANAEQGYLAFFIGGALSVSTRANKLGRVLGGGVGLYTRRNPDRVRAADVAFISRQRLPQRPQPGFLTVAPELVVEIMSPDDRWQEVRQKIQEYFAIGVERVWVVEPENQEVVVYRSATESQVLTMNDTLLGEGVLTGFALPVAQLFAED